ncbi:putative diguanylate cyclase YcdT [Hartmannibacter diazotrophicus]|uniref:diguanylate cyclase n=1 Tax=Hartmannibacter diazotrophicus TaxID=1482074 RepID=A0A2C9D7X7_9HYPH|nr:GGDEF domain-containing protein [Hartmannibacter diazotrophicus]SON56238.1 putative diguanylate cyclase YcdT [Hartmannibacter diazotrophicus]
MLDLKTVFIFSAAINLFIVAVATVAWLRSENKLDFWYWCLASWLMVGGSLMMSMDKYLPYVICGYVGGMIYISSTGFLLLGFKEFFHQPYRLSEAFTVAILVGLGIVVMDQFTAGTTKSVSLLYVGPGLNLLLMARAVWRGGDGENLPSRHVAAVILLIYAVSDLFIAPIAFFDPIRFVDGIPVSEWLKTSSIPLVLLQMATYLMAVVLKLERATEGQRLLAEKDALTGVLNRRAFYSRVEAAAGRDGTLAVIDLDHFKTINDSHGHQGGDEVLRGFCQLVREHLPADAIFGRLGGEEFGLCLPDCDEQDAQAVLDRLRRRVEDHAFRSHNGAPLSVTISCGHSVLLPDQRSVNETLSQADHALYGAKNAGRNRVHAFHAGHAPTPRAERAGVPLPGQRLGPCPATPSA